MTARTTLALAAFALRTNLRMWLTRAGFTGAGAIIMLAAFLPWRAGSGWHADSDLAGYGYFVGLLFALRSGLEEQRETGLVTFLRHNLVSPVEHAVAGSLALVATGVIYTVFALLVMVLAGAGGLATVFRELGSWLFWAALVLPFIPMVEAVARLRLPAVLPFVVFMALLVVLHLALGEARALMLTRGTSDITRAAPLLPRLLRVATAFAGGFGLYIGGTAVAARARSLRLARSTGGA